MTTHSMHGSFVVICIFLLVLSLLFKMQCQQTEMLPFLFSLNNRILVYCCYYHCMHSLGLREMSEVLHLNYFMILLFSLFLRFFFVFCFLIFEGKNKHSFNARKLSPWTYNHVILYKYLEYCMVDKYI